MPFISNLDPATAVAGDDVVPATEATATQTGGGTGLTKKVSLNQIVGAGLPGVFSESYTTKVHATPAPDTTQIAASVTLADTTTLPSSQSGGLQTLRIDLQCNGVDDDANRSAMILALSKQNFDGSDPKATAAIDIKPTVGSWDTPIRISATYSHAAIDLSGAVADGIGSGHGVLLGDDHSIAFDTAGNSQARFNSKTGTTEVIGGLSFLNRVVIGDVQFSAVPANTAVDGTAGYLPATLADGTVIRIPYQLAGAITLTGITLNGGTDTITVNAGVSTGFTIGTLAVQATNGDFTGALSLSGADVAHFTLGGQGSVVTVTDGLPAGTYHFTATATQDGATGSPISQDFTVVATAVVTLTGITVAGGTGTITLASPVADGATIGAIAVQATGGSFSGTLALSGADGSHFAIVGSTLKAAGALTSTTYNFTITATQAGATRSPLSQAFTVVVVTGVALTGITLAGGTAPLQPGDRSPAPSRSLALIQCISRLSVRTSKHRVTCQPGLITSPSPRPKAARPDRRWRRISLSLLLR